MKRLELPHQLADYLCPVNGLCDIYEWKTGKRIPEELLFFSRPGFQLISQKRAPCPKMVFFGQGSIGKDQFKYWRGLIGYNLIAGEGKSFKTTMAQVKSLFEQNIPIVLFGMDMYHLPYHTNFYHTQHIPGHVVLMVGLDEENIYVHDNSKQGVQYIPLNDLQLAWANDYIGISKKNAYFAIDIQHPNLDISAIVQQGLAQNANLYLNSPVNFIGQRGLDRLIKEIPSWADTFSKDALEKIYLHLIEFSGSTIPELPKEISGFSSGVVNPHQGGRDKLATALHRYKDTFGVPEWEIAANHFLTSGRIIETIVSAALKSGMAKEDIIVDGLVATVGANPNAAVECLETIAYCRKHDLATVCGLSNISFGLPERSCINTAFLTAAITRGLTMAIANPAQKALVDAAYAADLLMNKPGADLRYIRRANRLKGEASFGPGDIPRTPGSSGAPVSPRQRVFDCVVEGGKGRILEEVKLALKDGEDPKGLIDGCLIPAINRVGELFEQQAYFLPQLISSAGAMQNAIAYLEPMIKREAGKEDTAVIIMATVEGDIHDIGKNLVVLMLRNYGYRVIDLGKDVTAERIVEAAIREHAAIIGLSALMTTTMMRMKDVVELAAKKNCGSRIIIGGAAVTESFAEEIGAHGYSKDAAECVRLVERLLKNTPDSQ